MHEFSLMADLLKKIEGVARDNGAQRVTKVRVWLGAFAHISASHFREHFEEGTRGSLAEGATLVVDESDDQADPHAQEIVLKEVDVA